MKNPALVLADEPTANLDTRRGLEILELLAGIARDGGCSVLLATHDPQATAVADGIYALRDGKLLTGEEALSLSGPAPSRFLTADSD